MGLTLQQFTDSVLDLLKAGEAQLRLGRALSDESRLARQRLATIRETLRAGEIKVLELELRFARGQFDAMSSAAPAHKTSGIAGRLWQLQRRIEHLEARLVRLRGAS